jgi:hypothetical protein
VAGLADVVLDRLGRERARAVGAPSEERNDAAGGLDRCVDVLEEVVEDSLVEWRRRLARVAGQ